MKREYDIQKVHDILHAVICNEHGLDLSLNEDYLKIIKSIHDCLCWILGHEGGITFEKNIELLQSEIEKRGFIMSRIS